MNAVYIKLLEELNSSVFVLLLILAFAFIAIWKVSGWLSAQKEKSSNITNTLDKIEIKIDIIPELKGKLDLIYNNTLATEKNGASK